MRPGVVSALGWLLLVPALYASASEWVTLRKVRDVWRGSDAINGELDASLACDLVSDFVKAYESPRGVRCEGTPVLSGATAMMPSVMVDGGHRSYCLARAPGWTVLRSTRSMPCFPTPPPDGANPVDSERQRVFAAATERVTSRLEGIRKAMASEVRPEKCPAIQPSSIQVPLLEFEILEGAGQEAWAFLSTPWLRDAVVRGERDAMLTALDRWSEWDRWALGAIWVAVITSASREEPHGGSIIQKWTPGQLTGSISLVDAEAGTLLCEAPFAFRSSATIERPPPPSFKKGRYNIAPIAPILTFETDEQVRGDFRVRYRAAAVGALRDMTASGVRPLD